MWVPDYLSAPALIFVIVAAAIAIPILKVVEKGFILVRGYGWQKTGETWCEYHHKWCPKECKEK